MANDQRDVVYRIMLAIGLFQMAAYWFSGSMACDEGILAVPQPDTPLYYQAARRIVEGHPFSFSEGSAACTGTTTVLYPFLLAIPYALGATGDSMLWAGFIVNAFLYLVFLFSWSVAIRNWCQSSTSILLASMLVALSAHCAYVTFAQSDIGFLLAYTALLASALSADRRWAIGVLLAIGPWVRPEGMICVVAYTMITLVYFVLQRYLPNLREKVIAADFLICVVSIVSCLGVFALNYVLTGHAQFSSVAGKGYFVQLDFAMAAFLTISDFVLMIKELFFGLAKGLPRDFVSVPGLGMVLLLTGIVAYKWQERRIRGLFVLALAALGGLLSVAQSGWQNTNLDRYIVWIFPLVIIFVSEAVVFIENRFMPPNLHKLPSVLIIMGATFSAVSLLFIFNAASRFTNSDRLFWRDCDKLMLAGASCGSDGSCGMAYFSSPRRYAHISGIYSPEFSPKSHVENVERLRHCPKSRFDYWVFTSNSVGLFGKRGLERFGDVVLSGPEEMSLVKVDWAPFEISDASKNNGMSLVTCVDVGYEADEEAVDYHVITRWGLEVFDPFVQCGELGDKFIVDAGRAILGGDEMSVPLKPGVEATVVMRTWPSHIVRRTMGYPSKPIDCSFSNPLRFNIAVDGNVVDTAEVSYSTNSFSDVSFKIPGMAIKNPVSRIGFLGDHITFGYWFYQ